MSFYHLYACSLQTEKEKPSSRHSPGWFIHLRGGSCWFVRVVRFVLHRSPTVPAVVLSRYVYDGFVNSQQDLDAYFARYHRPLISFDL